MSELNIYQRVNEAMKVVSYIKKDTVVQGYKAVTHDNVMALVRPSLILQGIVIVPQLKASNVVPGKTSTGKDKIRYEAFYHIDFVNIDEPKDKITVEIESHADDHSDKAPGKAISYAVKYAILKLFGLETGDDDESRMADQMEEAGLLKELEPTAKAIIEAIANDDPSVALEAWRECSELEMKLLWKAKTKGGFFSMKEKDYIRSAQISDSGE